MSETIINALADESFRRSIAGGQFHGRIHGKPGRLFTEEWLFCNNCPIKHLQIGGVTEFLIE
jgi:hypothetical protein